VCGQEERAFLPAEANQQLEAGSGFDNGIGVAARKSCPHLQSRFHDAPQATDLDCTAARWLLEGSEDP